MRKRLKTIIRWLNVLLIIATLLSLIAPYVNPNKLWLLAPFGAIFPILAIGNILFIIFWIYRKKWYFLISLACLAIGWNAIEKSYGFNFSNTTVSTSDTSLKVMSYNIESLYGFLEVAENPGDIKPAVDFLNQHELDIILLQELSNREFLNSIRSKEGHRYRTFFPDDRYMGIVTTFPILNGGRLAFENHYNGCSYADLKIGKDTIRVYNVHLKSNLITQLANDVATNGDIKDKETWGKVKAMFQGYVVSAKIRAQQALDIAAHISESPYKVIVGGDFNDVPQSFAYRTLSKGLKDHFQQKGKGRASTFAGSLPFLRIDFILSDPSFKVARTYIDRNGRSDHLPVISEFSLK